MIVKMLKYQFVLHASECDTFITKVRDLGMVDITTSGWEPTEGDRSLILDIESHAKAEKQLKAFMESETFDSAAKGYATSAEAYAAYQAVSGRESEISSRIEELKKLSEEALPWGEFSGEALRKIEAEGIKISYFTTPESEFEAIVKEREDLTLVAVNTIDNRVYFVVVMRGDEANDLNIDAQMVKPLSYSTAGAKAEIEALEVEKAALSGEMSRAAVSLPLIAEGRADLSDRLQLSRVSHSAEAAAEGSLLVMEAWAEEAKAATVEELFNAQESLFYIKSRPTPSDNTPVKLENNRFAKLFELIGNLYATPKYGTIDLTPYFAPFYMMFFAICLCDAGYGAFILTAGILLYKKGGAKLRQAAWMTIMCGTAAVIFGFLANSIFGMPFSGIPALANFKFIDFQGSFFTVSMIIGIIQILFGMLINIVVTTTTFGIKYAFGSIGWFLMLFSAVLSGALSSMGISGFEFDSVPFYIAEGVGFGLLLFLNSPEKNIFANIGSGLWETYDKLTGLMSDVLSYVRLFAIGLSGGVLALVFNDLAVGMTGLNESWADQSVGSLIVKIIIAAMILLLGHGINLFMSTISSFVHPMRLTFVEFYKNAGFVMGTRKFEPLQREEE